MLSVKEKLRDVKGHYSRARQGMIKHFKGMDDSYGEPERPGRVIETVRMAADEGVEKIMRYLKERGYVL
jgi:adenylylsulfate kinase-like enzyme